MKRLILTTLAGFYAAVLVAQTNDVSRETQLPDHKSGPEFKAVHTYVGFGFGLSVKDPEYYYMNLPFDYQMLFYGRHQLLLELEPHFTGKQVGKLVHMVNYVAAYNYQHNTSGKVAFYGGGGICLTSGKYLTGKVAGDNIFKKIDEFNFERRQDPGLYLDLGMQVRGAHAGINLRFYGVINNSSQFGFSLITNIGGMHL